MVEIIDEIRTIISFAPHIFIIFIIIFVLMIVVFANFITEQFCDWCARNITQKVMCRFSWQVLRCECLYLLSNKFEWKYLE